MKRGVRVVNENSGLIMVSGIRGMPGPIWERRRGQAWERLSARVPEVTRLGCTPPAR